MATDSTAMTIDFLRARLLSERSVSRAARERADQLAQRVVELEEQLRLVSTQRKKAEKAATEVLAILESQGIDYLTEPEGTDSSSDRDEVEGGRLTVSVPKKWECDGNSPNSNSNSTGKDEASKSNGSNAERSEVEDAMSGSEIDGQVVAGSLSWKGRSKSPESHKKHRAAKNLRHIRPRRIFYFTSPDPSPKYQMGKSCRKNKPKDFRSVSEDGGEKRECSDGNKKGEGESDKTEDEQIEFYVEVSREDSEISRGMDGNVEQMEKALEEQAQLIGQFQAEENAQREWEKMYNQNRNASKDDFESENKEVIGENRSNKTESHEEANARPEILHSTADVSITTTAQENTDAAYEKAIVTVFDENANTNATFSDDGLLKEYSNSEMHIKEVESVPDDSTAAATTKERCSSCTQNSISMDQLNEKEMISIPNSPSSRSLLSNSSQTHEDNPLALQLYEPPTESRSNSCSAVDDVLESLRRAKVSLRENLSKKLHLPDHQLLAITDCAHGTMDPYPTTRGSRTLDTQPMNIPVGSSSGLFRLPTDSFPKPGISQNFLSLEYSTDLTNQFLINSTGVATGDNLRTKLLLDPQSALMAVPDPSASTRYSFDASSNLTSEMASSLHTNMARFYDDLTRALPAGDRLSFYGGDSFTGLRML